MKKNMGSGDRILRMILAILFVTSFFLHVIIGLAGWVFLIIGVVFIITSLVGFCPVYAYLGCNTCNADNEEQ